MAENAKSENTVARSEDTQDATVAFKSFAGLSLMLLVLAAVFYIPGFGGTAWGINNSDETSTQVGLWQSCTCTDLSSDALKGKLRKVVDTKGAQTARQSSFAQLPPPLPTTGFWVKVYLG